MQDRNRIRRRHSAAVVILGLLLLTTVALGRSALSALSAAPAGGQVAFRHSPPAGLAGAGAHKLANLAPDGSPTGECQQRTVPNPASPAGRLAAGTTLPAPAQDPCLHCHITGENHNPITPSFRWALFGGMGLVFLLGMIQSVTIWRSRRPWQPLAARVAAWLDARFAIAEPLRGALAKPVPGYARQWFYCLGGITAFLFVTQAITGTLLAFYYKPTPAEARASIEFIQNEVRFGAGIRFIHQICSSAMIIVCIGHMIRVFIMGAYKPPRELTWVSGVALLLLTLAFGFTGYLLPWDQRAYWATTVGSEIAGSMPIIGGVALLLLRVGWDVSHLTLSRFYAAHVLVLPALTVVMMLAHFWMIRRLGIARPL